MEFCHRRILQNSAGTVPSRLRKISGNAAGEHKKTFRSRASTLQPGTVTAVFPSEFVNAPIINEFLMTVECNLLKFNEDGICIGEIVNVNADESILTDDMIDYEKLKPISYDPVNHYYLKLGEIVGYAFEEGKKLK